MSDKVKIRVLSAFTLSGGAVAEPGEIIELDALAAYDLAPSQGQLLDAERAQELINAAAKTATEAAARKCGPAPRAQTFPFALASGRYR